MTFGKRLRPARQVRERYSVSDMTLWRWLRDEGLRFPQPIIINSRRYFDEEELEAWERSRASNKEAV